MAVRSNKEVVIDEVIAVFNVLCTNCPIMIHNDMGTELRWYIIFATQTKSFYVKMDYHGDITYRINYTKYRLLIIHRGKLITKR